jgi:inositol-phosphate transport system permease protein
MNLLQTTLAVPLKALRSVQRSSLLLLFLGPTMMLVLLFYFVPVILTSALSFTSMDQAFRWNYVGPDNFVKIFTGMDPRVPRVVVNTVIYVVFALILTVGMGLVIALVTTHIREGAGIFFRAVWMLPNLTPPVVYILLWKWFFDPTRYGFLNSLRSVLGLPPNPWLTQYALPIVIPINAFIGLSFCMVVFTSAIKSMPAEIFDAAKIDGASRPQIVWYVILPLLRWPIMFMTAWHLLAHLNSYVYILLLTGGGPFYRSEVWALYAFHKSFQFYEFGYGAALAMILVSVSVALTLAVWKVFGFGRLMEPARIEVS